jgi:DNA-binding CsgD family transcriptional regulator
MCSAASADPGTHYPAVLANVPHGSHICAFYETMDDLFGLVLPFFEIGLDRVELCVWMTPDLISEDEARLRASSAVKRGLEFQRGRDLYLRRRRFRRDLMLRFWDEKMQEARATHHAGARLSGDAFWLQRNDWDAFLEYEADINTTIADKPLTMLCTYPFSVSRSGDVFDVVRAHQVAITMRHDEWEVLTAPMVHPDRRAEAMDAAARVASLTPRERQVLDAIIDGRPNKVIAHELSLDVRTIEAHRTRLMRRLGVRTMVEAVRLGTLARFGTWTTPAPIRR